MTWARRLHERAARQERGAQAVEFALVIPLILVLVLGVLEFGRLLNIHISVSGAAREGARVMAIHDDAGAAEDAAKAAAPALDDTQLSVSVGPCDPGQAVTVTVSYPLDLTLLFLNGANVKGTGVMRCGG